MLLSTTWLHRSGRDSRGPLRECWRVGRVLARSSQGSSNMRCICGSPVLSHNEMSSDYIQELYITAFSKSFLNVRTFIDHIIRVFKVVNSSTQPPSGILWIYSFRMSTQEEQTAARRIAGRMVDRYDPNIRAIASSKYVTRHQDPPLI